MTSNHSNYAGPGARVGIQAGTVVITGGIRLTDDDVLIGGQITVGDEDDEGERGNPG